MEFRFLHFSTNPDYFLSINYGPKYMEHLKSKNFSHKNEKWIDEPVINLDAALLKLKK